jgi:hypothetical protein
MTIKTKQQWVFMTILLLLSSCATMYFRKSYDDHNALIHQSDQLKEKPYLKAHIINGDVFIFDDSWQLDTIHWNISGNGTHYDINRKPIQQGSLKVHLDSISLFETNKKLKKPESERITALAILLGANAITAGYCIINPKACFGSCPTFYVNENDDFRHSDAEGFSNAILPSLSYFDIDAIGKHQIPGHTFSLTMKNEALETHCVKNVQLLAYPILHHQRVHHTRNDQFFLCEQQYLPTKATAPEGNILPLLLSPDKNERFSMADEKNLNSREHILLEFSNLPTSNQLGLELHFRQTLMTTYFIYSALGYMGDRFSDYLSGIEHNAKARNQVKKGIKDELGDIDIYTWNDLTTSWEFQGGVYETGPIAINKQLVPLSISSPSSHLKIKIVLNKGLWRMDYASLTQIMSEVQPIAISPHEVTINEKKSMTAYEHLLNPEKHLISMPGDAFKLHYTLPQTNLPQTNSQYELFIRSGGYYLEWMREEWLKEKNLLKLYQMVYRPAAYLKKETSNYKTYEKTMEDVFWNSKINTQTFTHYEN